MNRSENPVKQLRVLHVFFRNSIRFENIPAFRAAISNVAGHEHILFHQHDGEGYLYKYPKIQYKVVSGRPMLLCIDTAIEELSHFFSKEERIMMHDGKKQQIEVSSMRQHYFDLRLRRDLTKYRIMNWIPLNQTNVPKYSEISAVKERIIFLEKILTANILSFAKGVGWSVPGEIKVNMLSFPSYRIRHIKNVNMLVFTAEFETNVFLPDHTGLGKMSSIGYGTVKSIK